MGIVEAYSTYYKIRSLPAAKELYKAIYLYNFSNYISDMECIYSMYKNLDIDSFKLQGCASLKSGGTTALMQREYVFGPYAAYWISAIESSIKYKKYYKTISIYNGFWNKSINIDFKIEDERIIYDYKNQHHINELIKYINLSPRLNISCIPTVALHLCQTHAVREALINNKCIINTTGWSAFYKRNELLNNNVHINDNMVNWNSMANYYTCQYNRHHFLPTFYISNNSIINLLNISGLYSDMDDYYKVDDTPKMCRCGRTYHSITYIPHYKYSIISNSTSTVIRDITIIERLESKLSNLQFVQESADQINVLYEGELTVHDKKYIQDYFNNHRFAVDFIDDSRLLTGISKVEPFWNNTFIKRKYNIMPSKGNSYEF